MAIIKYPNELETAVDAMADSDVAGFFQPGTTAGVRKQKKNLLSVWKSFFNLAAAQRGLIAGRFDSRELPESGSLTAGTYTIAETEDTADLASGCMLRIVSTLGVDLIEVDFKESASAKTHQNTKIELLNAKIGNFRLAKSDSINGAGAKIQIVLPSTTTLKVQLISNIGDSKGWQLVTPTNTGIGLCPDGSAATFLEAGAELSFIDGPRTSARFMGFASSNDQIICIATFPEIPKQGTGVIITLPSTNLRFMGIDGVLGAIITGGHAISSVDIQGKEVKFAINETGIATAIPITAVAFPIITGAGMKLTIT